MSVITKFFAMGGFGNYVWSAYGICILVILGQLIGNKMKERQIRRRLQQFYMRVPSEFKTTKKTGGVN